VGWVPFGALFGWLFLSWRKIGIIDDDRDAKPVGLLRHSQQRAVLAAAGSAA
jgi:hypothetical protein